MRPGCDAVCVANAAATCIDMSLVSRAAEPRRDEWNGVEGSSSSFLYPDMESPVVNRSCPHHGEASDVLRDRR
jgi:hypothetical protein